MPDLPASPVDLDLRLVRYFTVVAEHQHFGRAAAVLHLAQPSLSRYVRRLEEQLGVRLLERTPQGSHLTDAGRVFLPQAEALLRSAQQAVTQVRAAARPGTITIGFTSHVIVTPAVRELRHRHPDAEVRTLHLEWNEPHTALVDHRVDVAVARPPFRTDGLEVAVLYDEPRVVVVPTSHRLAGKQYVTLDDIADDPMPRYPDAAWNAFWRIDPRPGGRPAPGGPIVEAHEDKYEVVAGGQAIALSPAGAHVDSIRGDLTTVPLDGVEPGQVVVATRAGDRGHLVSAFLRTATTHLTSWDGRGGR